MDDNTLASCQNKAQPALRKVKKKKGKDEMDRLKQAEKKKRRLEKALATSAAIRSELEKKKQKNKEEQQRLDEEGAAIAEAVALHVLLGEDSEETHKIVLNKYKGAAPWDYSGHCGFLTDGRRASFGGDGWLCPYGMDLHRLHLHGRGWPSTELLPSPGLVAAQAVSSLRIRDDAHLDAVFLDGIL